MGEEKYEPRYSGPENCGICVCGHSWKKHHLGMVLNTDYYKATKEAYVPMECEYYGANEFGGLDSKGCGHCSSYRDRGVKKRKRKYFKKRSIISFFFWLIFFLFPIT